MSSAVRVLPDATSFEVCSVSADALRARLAVAGRITCENIGLVTSAVKTHVRAGRRYVRVDVSAAVLDDADVLATLARLHDSVRATGGMLVLEHPTGVLAELLADLSSGARAAAVAV